MRNAYGCLVLALLVLAGCGRGTEERTVVESYSVPPERVEAVVSALHVVLSGAPPVGTASAGAPGEVIVRAPGYMQASIRRTIEKQMSDGALQSVPESLELRVWLVEAVAGDEDAGMPAVLDEVLAEHARQRGPHRYRLIDQASLALVSSVDRDRSALTTRRGLNLLVRAWPAADGHRLNVELFRERSAASSPLALSALQAELLLRPGEFVVLSHYTGIEPEQADSQFAVVQLVGRDG